MMPIRQNVYEIKFYKQFQINKNLKNKILIKYILKHHKTILVKK